MKINNVRNSLNRGPIKTFTRFGCLSEDESLNEILEANDSNERLVFRKKSGESDSQDNKYNSRFHWQKGNQRTDSNTKKVTALVGDSIIKAIKGLEISDRENKFAALHFPGVETDDRKSCVVVIKQKTKTIVMHCSTNDLKTEKDCWWHTRISSPMQIGYNNVIISGL